MLVPARASISRLFQTRFPLQAQEQVLVRVALPQAQVEVDPVSLALEASRLPLVPTFSTSFALRRIFSTSEGFRNTAPG